ncbi:OLC1v1032002C1 [Oldenlandia corymbosa var. corymbosa]|uniref:OLC1v1032002C1 n=1 Tax=Oldenlandia corymbosa var. corymbosa TaxID=529605 RepID=A0AAV1CLV4_OLDCO|nr:OLC1v1032002C1 [Oldenlandia corymbosa var. corymbosa]
MDQGGVKLMSAGRSSSYDRRVVAICLALVAVVSPVYVDRMKMANEVVELEYEPAGILCSIISAFSYLLLPLSLLMLIVSISMSRYLVDDERSVSRFDPNWIHRVCSSSTGIIVLLLILSMVLRFKYS